MGGAEFPLGQALELLAFRGHSVAGVEPHSPQGREVGGRVAVACLVVVLPVDRVEHPVAAVLDAPVAADVGQHRLRPRVAKTADVVAGLAAGLAGPQQGVAMDHDDAADVLPFPTDLRVHPAEVVADDDGAGFDAVVAGSSVRATLQRAGSSFAVQSWRKAKSNWSRTSSCRRPWLPLTHRI